MRTPGVPLGTPLFCLLLNLFSSKPIEEEKSTSQKERTQMALSEEKSSLRTQKVLSQKKGTLIAFSRERSSPWSQLTVEAKKQRIVRASLMIWILLLLFPPFYLIGIGSNLHSREWHFFIQFDGGYVDIAMLFLELLLVGLIAGVCYHVLSENKERNPLS